MRVTFVLPYASLAGGVRVVAAYARELTERGHDVFVISRPAKKLRWHKRLRLLLAGQATSAGRKRPTPLLAFLKDQHIVLDCFRDITAQDVPDADVVIATWWDTAPAVAKLPPEKGRKFYLLQDYETFEYLPVDQVIGTYDLPLRKIAVSNFIKDELSRNHGIEDVSLVPNAIDTDLFDSLPRHRNDVFTVGFLCSSNPRKHVELAVSTIRQAKELFPELRVIVFGAKPPKERLRMPDWVEFHLAPDQSDIPSLYAACDLWLFTSASEGFGLPLLEAMACRTPVLATRTGAAADLIDGKNGIILPPDAAVFAEQIIRFARMPAGDWKQYSDHAYGIAHQYTWARATDTLLSCISGKPEKDADKSAQ